MELQYILQLLQKNSLSQRSQLQDITNSVKYTTKTDIKLLLEILNTSNDIEIIEKIFFLLGVYLVSGYATHRDVIVTSRGVYEKIYLILSKNRPTKLSTTLNFVAALLYDSEEIALTTKQSLTLYARNMMRISGSLSVFCNLFIDSMMHQDTWRSLCRSIAESCRNSYENQSYCTVLIPSGVQKCAIGDVDSTSILQSLLHNHQGNIKRFMECGGLSLFNRDLLQNSVGMELLHATVQNREALLQVVHNTCVVEILRDFLNLYGARSQIGQWATIILYHIHPEIKELNNRHIEDNVKSWPPKSISEEEKVKMSCDDTTRLFQNVFKEILLSEHNNQYRTRAYMGQSTKEHPRLSMKNNNNFNSTYCHVNNNNPPEMKHVDIETCNEMSFSFLASNDSQQHYGVSISAKETSTMPINQVNSKGSVWGKPEFNKTNSDLCLADFKPNFVSTPKKLFPRETKNLNTSNIRKMDVWKTKHDKKFERKIFRMNKRKEKQLHDKERKHRSFGSRLFSAINDSCTVLVKTVKNIFKTKDNDEIHSQESRISSNTDVKNRSHRRCNYSFMDYMRRRDGIFDNKLTITKASEVSSAIKFGDSCETCDDTLVLKHKFDNDRYLKQTVKKLKVGINLYGCDFKKISATLWPRESYMTPNVLYNLYRKLIVK